jgi:hypothetical protein
MRIIAHARSIRSTRNTYEHAHVRKGRSQSWTELYCTTDLANTKSAARQHYARYSSWRRHTTMTKQHIRATLMCWTGQTGPIQVPLLAYMPVFHQPGGKRTSSSSFRAGEAHTSGIRVHTNSVDNVAHAQSCAKCQFMTHESETDSAPHGHSCYLHACLVQAQRVKDKGHLSQIDSTKPYERVCIRRRGELGTRLPQTQDSATKSQESCVKQKLGEPAYNKTQTAICSYWNSSQFQKHTRP